jgi:hypothetical protein
VASAQRRGATERLFTHCTENNCTEWLQSNLRAAGWAEGLTDFVVEQRCSLGNTLFMECQEELKRWIPAKEKPRQENGTF